MIVSGGAPPGIYTLTENIVDYQGHVQDPCFSDTTGRTLKSSSITPGEKTGVLIIAGQSLAANSGATPYTPSNSKAHQLNVYDGLVYGAVDPLFGTSGTGGTWISHLADKLIDAGTFTRVIVLPLATGGSQVKDWTPSGNYFQRLHVAFLRIRALGWLDSADVHTAIIWAQGEEDNFLGTSQADYEAQWGEMKAGLDGCGYTGDWWVNKETMFSNAVASGIQAAQAAVVDNVTVFACADVDSLTGGTNRTDGTHLTDTGNVNCAELIKVKLAAHY